MCACEDGGVGVEGGVVGSGGAWNDSRPCTTVSGTPKMSHVIVAIQNTI